MTSNDLEWPQINFYRVLLIICFKISPISATFGEKPHFSTSDLHELHDRKLRNQFMNEQNREFQSYFWDIFTQENYFVWVREVFHISRIPTKLNLSITELDFRTSSIFSSHFALHDSISEPDSDLIYVQLELLKLKIPPKIQTKIRAMCTSTWILDQKSSDHMNTNRQSSEPWPLSTSNVRLLTL